jgi:hypothetical protein
MRTMIVKREVVDLDANLVGQNEQILENPRSLVESRDVDRSRTAAFDCATASST